MDKRAKCLNWTLVLKEKTEEELNELWTQCSDKVASAIASAVALLESGQTDKPTPQDKDPYGRAKAILKELGPSALYNPEFPSVLAQFNLDLEPLTTKDLGHAIKKQLLTIKRQRKFTLVSHASIAECLLKLKLQFNKLASFLLHIQCHFGITKQ
jgi:hypothetical protein